MVRLDNSIAGLAQQFIRVRVLNMRGVNLRVFDFDFDNSWAGFFLTPDEVVLGRFGGRDGDDPGKYLTFSGLAYAMQEALNNSRTVRTAYRAGPARTETVEDFPALTRLKDNACVHCHQVYEFRRQSLKDAGTWKHDMVWVYPDPGRLGIHLDPEQGNRIKSVEPGSPAQTLGLSSGDVLRRVNGIRCASFADVQYALDRTPSSSPIRWEWENGKGQRSADMTPPDRWRLTDLSWRASLQRLGPNPAVHGHDLEPDRKRTLGLEPDRLAMVLGPFLPRVARQAGLAQGDIVVGLDDKPLQMRAADLGVHIRLSYQPGQQITYNYLRDGKPGKAVLKLPDSNP